MAVSIKHNKFFESGTARTTVVGVLTEVLVMLFAVRMINLSADWYENKQGDVSFYLFIEEPATASQRKV